MSFLPPGSNSQFLLAWSFREILSENAVGQHVWGSGYKLDFRWPNHSLHSFEAWGAWGLDRSSGLSRLDLINELHNLSLRQIIWDSRVLSEEAKKFKGLLVTRCCISCINRAVMTQLSYIAHKARFVSLFSPRNSFRNCPLFKILRTYSLIMVLEFSIRAPQSGAIVCASSMSLMMMFTKANSNFHFFPLFCPRSSSSSFYSHFRASPQNRSRVRPKMLGFLLPGQYFLSQKLGGNQSLPVCMHADTQTGEYA